MSRSTEHLSSVTEMTILRQASQAGSMAAYQPPRSKFMIHDILGGNGKFNNNAANDDDRTPSPQSKDFSLFLSSLPEHEDDSDCDSSK